jgi:hypothetical protein
LRPVEAPAKDPWGRLPPDRVGGGLLAAGLSAGRAGTTPSVERFPSTP